MRRAIFLLGCALLPLAIQACKDDGGSTPSINDGGAGGTSAGGASGQPGVGGSAGATSGTSGLGGAGGAAAGDAGAAGTAGPAAGGAGGSAGAASGEGGAGQGGAITVVGGSNGLSGTSGAGGGPVVDPDPVCKQNQPWNPNPAINETVLPSGANGALKEQRTLAAMSGDGLTVAWTTQDKIFYADRTATTLPVQQYQQLPSSLGGSGYPAIDKVAVSGDRKRLVMVSLDRTRLGELARVNVGESFGDAINENPFAEVIKARQGEEQIGDPVLVSDDTALYLAFFTSETSRLVVSRRAAAGEPWGAPAVIDDPDLASSGSERKRLWWVSRDQLTVFVLDPATKTSRALWRKNLTKPFDVALPIGAVQAPYSDDGCIRLTYSAPNGQNALDVFTLNKI